MRTKTLKMYFVARLLQYVFVVFLGLTLVFLIPRLLPQDPIRAIIGQFQQHGAGLDAKTVETMVATFQELFGLSGSLLNQYVVFWKRIATLDFGPSFFQFPTPVSQLIRRFLPWTLGLMLTSTVLAWLFGNIAGGIAGYFSQKKWAKILDTAATIVRPMPHYVFGLVLLILFAYLWKIFPLGGGASIGKTPSLTLASLLDVLRHSFLPALTLVLLNGAAWYHQMRFLVQNVKNEDFVRYAKFGGVCTRQLVLQYVIRNAMLPQITGLALSIGQIYSAAIIVEIVFSYPGLGTLLFEAISRADYNLIMGIAAVSIFTVSTLVLVVDLFYPVLDPRIRYR
ncbi:MAG: ABC transporter permease [Candidatus Caldatribacterium sp.]|uniref:ABC transporter permease n=1 Tax=Candidatus Caldatribacterium sp. TaxID=2282143 RepID=UPI0029973232|nr:ABC transporter permease [Candidatus Caldatribacterium sp.]MCX7730124.1 ABC transporter permease [Candidatus Caldatribacterium sp.]MDW8081078.1 ABC transporter permease [Candidatus Calescibacterium sp.]